MKSNKEWNAGRSRKSLAGTALVLAAMVIPGRAAGSAPQNATLPMQGEQSTMPAQSKLFCNIKALTPEQRQRLKVLAEKLLASRKELVETAKGYEFQFSPADVTVAEVAEWVTMESQCCSFFDFHIDLENEGKLICLRLTGEEGIKAFIRHEFQLKENAAGMRRSN